MASEQQKIVYKYPLRSSAAYINPKPPTRYEPVYIAPPQNPEPNRGQSYRVPETVRRESYRVPEPVRRESYRVPEPVRRESYRVPEPVRRESYRVPEPVRRESSLYKATDKKDKQDADLSLNKANTKYLNTAVIPDSAICPSAQLEFKEPIPLFYVNKVGLQQEIVISKDVINFLENEIKDRRVILISIFGPSETGKSYISNLLLNNVGRKRQSRGFLVRDKHNEGTDGVWIWGGTLEDDVIYLFLDFEGISSNPKYRSKVSVKLFTLGLILSNYFIFNSKGQITDEIMNDFGLLHEMQKSKKAWKAPPLLWLLRDFDTRLEDGSGNLITANEYLDICLHDNQSFNTSTKEIRKDIIQIFPNRECETLCKPLDTDLEHLMNYSLEELNTNFRRRFCRLKTKIFQSARLESKLRLPLTGKIFSKLLEKYVNNINNNKFVEIYDTWDNIQLDSCELNFQNIKKKFSYLVQEFINDAPYNQIDIDEFLRKNKKNMFILFHDLVIAGEDYMLKYKAKLKEDLDDICKKANELNIQATIELMNAFIRDIRIDQNKPIEEEITRIKKKCFDEVKGPELIIQRRLYEAIIEVYRNYVQNETNTYKQEKIQSMKNNENDDEKTKEINQLVEKNKTLSFLLKEEKEKCEQAEMELRKIERKLRNSQEEIEIMKQKHQKRRGLC